MSPSVNVICQEAIESKFFVSFKLFSTKPKGSIVVKIFKISKLKKNIEIQPVRPTEVCGKV